MQETDPNTDIYKSREPMPIGGKTPRRDKRRKRRSNSNRAFDDQTQRKRRSRNTGFRRLLHLLHKSDNEKYFWSTIGVSALVVLVLIGVWQFWVRELLIRGQEKKNDYLIYQPSIPTAADTAPILPEDGGSQD